MVNAHPRETSLLTPIIGYDDREECLKVEQSIAQVQRSKCWVKRLASVTALLPLLAITGLGYETMLQKNFPYDGSHPVIRLLCEMGLASAICLVAFAGLLMGYRKKLHRLWAQCSPLANRLPELPLAQPDIGTLPGSHPRVDAPGAFDGAAEATGYPASLDSPSWRSNRVCG
jgi:hypothetical protein